MNGGEHVGVLRWYLIQCKPREEARALENLERQEFVCYRPVRAVERYRDGRTRASDEPLFPGYLFIRLDRVTDNWYAINSTRGVHQIVRFGEYPLPVPDDLIEGIRARQAASLAREPYLKPGDRVRIEAGAFAQTEAIFLVDDGNHRVVLLLNILQTEQRLSFPLASVRKVC
jgi:transcriptional antiterminator RfaH